MRGWARAFHLLSVFVVDEVVNGTVTAGDGGVDSFTWVLDVEACP